MPRLLWMIAALSLSTAALAQAPAPSAARQVQLLAPQLLAFTGSSANFDSLVNGLTLGTPVTLTTASADAGVQIVTFLPGTTLTAADAARSLEAARQSLISRGIALPSAQQLAIALMGGTLPTPAGSTPVTGVVSGNAGASPIQVRNELGPSPASGTNAAFDLGQANLQALRGGPPEQLGGALQGVLQGRVRNTSDSRVFGTSDSRVTGTSNTPASVNPVGRAVTVPGAGRAAPIFGASRR